MCACNDGWFGGWQFTRWVAEWLTGWYSLSLSYIFSHFLDGSTSYCAKPHKIDNCIGMHTYMYILFIYTSVCLIQPIHCHYNQLVCIYKYNHILIGLSWFSLVVRACVRIFIVRVWEMEESRGIFPYFNHIIWDKLRIKEYWVDAWKRKSNKQKWWKLPDFISVS